jgi:hypothetical protein
VEEGGGLRLFSSGFVKQPQVSAENKACGGALGGTDGEGKATHDDTCNNCGRTGH